MVVISLANCPPFLRGDLTKWLEEIDTGVYAGNVNARIRDKLWERVTKEIGKGRAVMVFTARNEQHMDFRVCNSDWEPIDFDGLKLMLRPSAEYRERREYKQRWRSSASGVRIGKKAAHRINSFPHSYVVVDVETTGLSVFADSLIEVGAIKIESDIVIEKYSALVFQKTPLPENIINLTGITNEVLQKNGVDEKTAISGLIDFSSDAVIVCHNARFDYGFIRAACKHNDLALFSNNSIDTADIARKSALDVENYKLSTLASYFLIQTKTQHRSIDDCITTKQLYDKLIEKIEKKV
ncbi:MAG: type I-E CRISPR-associated endoribonuclease Cas2e [Christensenella sp.]|nr:type I-E CRISPR-associated endoribonuclease Cas2e [Christensenella sp.]